MAYELLDGNGNKYVIKNETIEYIPMKPALSSSGFYDGGNYIKKEITALQYSEITSVINKIIRNMDMHIDKRVKMSGMITIQEENDKKVYIISPNSTELNTILEIIQDIIEN
jgi:hypothetical protein